MQTTAALRVSMANGRRLTRSGQNIDDNRDFNRNQYGLNVVFYLELTTQIAVIRAWCKTLFHIHQSIGFTMNV